MNAPVRMCSECLTIDAAFPKKPGCQSCAETLSKDEYKFWNTPLYYEEEVSKGLKVHVGVNPQEFLRRIVQPWRTALRMITLT